MARKENVEKNMEFLIKELQKEWDISKETKHKVSVSVEDAKKLRIKVQQQIADVGELLQNQESMSFKESMRLCRENFVTLRVARKIIAGEKEAKDLDYTEFLIPFDKDEYSCFRKLVKE